MFWFGDLNYRIDSSIPALEVLDHAQSRRLLSMAENDQLNIAREAGDAFDGFQEGEMGKRVQNGAVQVCRCACVTRFW